MSANSLKFQVKLPKDLGGETYWAPCGQVFINLEDNTGTLYLNWMKEPFRLFVDDREPYKKGRKR